MIIITFHDKTGSPRAWACGDNDKKDEILEYAKSQKNMYEKAHPNNPLEPKPFITFPSIESSRDFDKC